MGIIEDRNKGLTYSEIGRKYNIDRRTAKKYCSQNFSSIPQKKNTKHSLLDEYDYYIEDLLIETPYSAERIKEKLEESFNLKISYSTVQRRVRKIKDSMLKKATIRFETQPGLQAQVDWAEFEKYRVYEKGKEKKIYCFLMILGYSRMRYIEFVTETSTETFIRCHLNAFQYFGGNTKEILYDNLKQVVIKRVLKQSNSTFNKTFEEFASFLNFKPILCRPYRGQTKGKVERTVRFVRENLMNGIKYTDLTDLNTQAIKWCEKVNNRPHSTTNEIPKLRLKEEHLNNSLINKLSNQNCIRLVQKDCLFSYKGNKYSVPQEYINKRVLIIELNGYIAVYSEGRFIAIHSISSESNTMNISKDHYRPLLRFADKELVRYNPLLENEDITSFNDKIKWRDYDL